MNCAIAFAADDETLPAARFVLWPILADPGTVTMRGCGVAPATASGCVEHEAILVADNRSAGRRARSCATQLWPLRFCHQKGTKALQQCFLSRLAQKPRAEAPLFSQKSSKKPGQAKFLHGDSTSDSDSKGLNSRGASAPASPSLRPSLSRAVADGSHLNGLEIFSAAG